MLFDKARIHNQDVFGFLNNSSHSNKIYPITIKSLQRAENSAWQATYQISVFRCARHNFHEHILYKIQMFQYVIRAKFLKPHISPRIGFDGCALTIKSRTLNQFASFAATRRL